MKIAALIVAAGRGARAGGEVPKQYAVIGGAPVLWHTVKAFSQIEKITEALVVIHPGDQKAYGSCFTTVLEKLRPPVSGGATRQASVLAGLEALASNKPDYVLIHDAARPFVSHDTVMRVIEALLTNPGAIAAVPLADTLKRADSGGLVSGTLDRTGLWRAQTPQGFRFDAILKAHRDAAAAGMHDFTDDAAVAEWAGLNVALVEDSTSNIKLTTAEDIAGADRRLRNAMNETYETRTGTGFDCHR